MTVAQGDARPTDAADACANFPAIGDYAIIGDGRTIALVCRSGAIEWLCLPDLDSSSVCAAILDRARGGSFAVSCRGGGPIARRYRGDCAILETDFRSPEGTFRVLDCLTIAGDGSTNICPQRELLRVVECVSGTPTVDVHFAPAPEYGRQRARFIDRGKLGWVLPLRSAILLLRSHITLSPNNDGALAGSMRLAPGERVALSLSFSDLAPAVIPPLGEAADRRLKATEDWWARWLSLCSYKGPHRDRVVRSLITLKMLQFCLSGAMTAAATTSLPESIPGSRNWDYRFCWLRDSGFVLRAFIDTGFWREGKAFFDWMMHSTQITQPRLQPLYTLYGRNDIGEYVVPTLAGYCGCGPVRIGNAAAKQFQLDTYGTLIGAARDFVARGHKLAPGERVMLTRLGKTICAYWREADQGIWEFRSAPRHYTYSKAMAWAGLNDLIWLADNHGLSIPRAQFEKAREELHARLTNDAMSGNPRRFKGAFDLDYPDAALLLLPNAGLIAADDPAMRATWEYVREQLDKDGMLLRYPRRLDSMAGDEGCFVICNFWAAEYLARARRYDEADRYFERAARCANDLGLLAEESMPDGALLGNFPQAFSHCGLISAALALEGRTANPEREKAA